MDHPSDGHHASLRSLTAHSSSGSLGLSLNKHGPSTYKASPPPPPPPVLPNRQIGKVAASLPPLNLQSDNNNNNSSNSSNMDTLECDAYLQRTRQQTCSKVTEACRSLLFAATSLHAAVRRCLTFESGLSSILSPAFIQSTTASERLIIALDRQQQQQDNEQQQQLVKSAITCTRALKELCSVLHQNTATLIQSLDVKFARHILVMVHTTAVDIKDVWQILPRHQRQPQQQHQKVPMRGRSHSDHTASTPTGTSMGSPIASPSVDDRSQLYTHLKLAVTHSLHVTGLLKQSIEETLATEISSVLATKLRDLARQAQDAAERAVRLDKNLQVVTAASADDTTSRKGFWQDTNQYLKVMVSVMSSVRSISTQEDFNWPKPVKQGCLQVTRVTAEVAKLWNHCSTFVDDGFYLGKNDSTPLTASSTTTTAAAASTATTTNTAISSNTTTTTTSSPRRMTATTTYPPSDTLNVRGELSSSAQFLSSEKTNNNNIHNTTNSTNNTTSSSA